MASQEFPTPWLGSKYGYLTDWITQRSVKITGRTIDPGTEAWLSGPIGKPHYVGKAFFSTLAAELGLSIDDASSGRGLMRDFYALGSSTFDPDVIAQAIVNFYEHTSEYDLDAWAEWRGVFRPFGYVLAYLFSRRLQQLNLPLSALDTSHGITSDVIHLKNNLTGAVEYTGWVRELKGTGNVLYAGSYSLCQIPLNEGQYVKVVFPLPHGNVVVVMKPQQHNDGSFSLASIGNKFGEPGFYFTVRNVDGSTSAKYVRAIREVIHVYAMDDGGVRADHVLKLSGVTFLRLHYRLRKVGAFDSNNQ
jgi:hypothetical protein